MSKFYISIPFAIPLSREQNWLDTDGKKVNFAIIRCHFMVNERQLENKTALGEILSAFQVPTGATVGKVRSIEIEHERIDYEESLEESLTSSELVSEMVESICAKSNILEASKLAVEVKEQWTERLKSEFHSSFKYSTTVRKRKIEKQRLSYDLKGTNGNRMVVAASYKRMAYDVYLGYVDFLFVRYEKSIFGLRKKRKHSPHYYNGKPCNLIKLNVPVCCIKFWKQLNSDTVLVEEKDYEIEVQDPSDIELCQAENLRKYHIDKPDKPTLYQLAVAAFPLKWIHRKGDWTVEELKALEFDEARETGWWYTYGPGQNEW